MPKELTELRKKYRNISMKIRRSMIKKDSPVEELSNLDKSIADLYALTDNFLSPEEDGSYMIPDAGSLKLLKEAYLRCYAAASAITDKATQGASKDSFTELVGYIKEILDKDYEAIDAADPSKGLTLSQIIEYGRSIALDAKDYDIDKLMKTKSLPIIVNNRDNTTSEGVFIGPNADDDNIHKRYLAYFAIAKLIDPYAEEKGLVPIAEPVIMASEGGHVLGTFIKNPSGYNVNNADSPVFDKNAEVFDSPSAIRDISNIFIIDFIGGLITRDISGLNMNFGSPGGSEKMISVSAAGIKDAFSSEEFYTTSQEFKFAKSLKVIDAKTAQLITSLEKETVAAILRGYGIAKAVIDNAWRSILLIKELIEAGQDIYKDKPVGYIDKDEFCVRVVSDNEWDEYNLETLGSNNNIYAQLSKLSDNKQTYLDRIADDDNEGKADEEPLVVDKLPQEASYDPDDAIRIGVENPPLIRIEINKDEKFNIVKGGVSSRIPVTFMKDGREVKGFFTKTTHVNGLERAKEVFDKYSKEHPEWTKEFSMIWDYVSQDINRYQELEEPIELEKVGIDDELAKQLLDNPQFKETLNSLWEEFKSEVFAANLAYVNFQNMDKDALFEPRSVLINKISEALGVSRVIAPTTNMQVLYGDELIDGIFMETVEGVNKEGLEGIPLKRDAFDGEVLRDIADMQVVDYLGLNSDRHTDNFICVFSKGDNPRCIKIIGIDNDNSFGTKSTSYAPGITDIVIMSRQTSEKILNMDPEALRRTLDGQGLPGKEVDAALNRLAVLRERLERGAIKIVKDDEWKELTLSEVVTMGSGKDIYKRILDDFNYNFELGDEQGKTGELSPRKFEYHKAVFKEEFPVEIVQKQLEKEASAEVMNLFSNRIKEALETAIEDEPKEASESYIDIAKNRFEELEEALNAVLGADSRYIRSSEQFRVIKRLTVNTIENMHNIAEKIEDGTFGMADVVYLAGTIDALGKAAVNYETYKLKKLKGHKPNNYEKGRLDAAKKLKNVAANLSKALEAKRELEQEAENMKVFKGLAPEKKIRETLIVLCDLVNDNNVSEKQLRKALAGIIYYNAVKKNIGRVRDDKNINNLFDEDIIDENIRQIQETQGFSDLFAEDVEKLRKEIIHDMGSSLFAEYVKKQAKYTKVPERNMKKKRSPEEIVNKKYVPSKKK